MSIPRKPAGAQQRAHFRLEYPPAERPYFCVGALRYIIHDLSEKGLRFAFDERYKPVVGAVFVARVEFKDGKSYDVGGKILRVIAAARHCVILLDPGIPLPKMMEEHRMLLQNYHKLVP